MKQARWPRRCLDWPANAPPPVPQPLGNDPAIISGPSGCAGLAGLMRACTDAEAFRALGLGPTSRVLLINSEGNLGEPLPA